MDDTLRFSKIYPYIKEKDICVIIALSVIFKKSYEEIMAEIGDNFRDFQVMKQYLIDNGYHEVMLPLKFCEKRMTVKQLARMSLSLPLVCFCGNHVVAIRDGLYFDTEDTGDLCVYSYFVKSQ